jgi:hypothetical protein
MLEYEVDNQRFLLEPGDSLIFAAQLIHRWRNPGNSVCNAIIIISAFEESERPVEYHLASMVSRSAREIELNETGDEEDQDDEVSGTGDSEEHYPEEI